MVFGKGSKSGNVTRSAERPQRTTTTQPASNNDNNNNKTKVVASESNEANNETLPSASLIATSQQTSSVGNAFATRLLNREVKVLIQPLGAENQWVENGDGLVEFNDFTIRVLRHNNGIVSESVPESEQQQSPQQTKLKSGISKNKSSIKGNNNNNNNNNDKKLELLSESSSWSSEEVLIEDNIDTDTPFVGENCCIVWNSFELQLSVCLMFTSEECFRAAWSALIALQEKPYPPLHIDFLPHTQEPSSSSTDNREGKNNNVASNNKHTHSNDGSASPNPDDSLASTSISASNESASSHATRPYSYYIHDKYNPPLGYIEQHALSLSIIEFRHDLNPALYTNKKTVLTLLELANIPLLEHLLSDDAFPLLLEGLELTNSTSSNTFNSDNSSNQNKNKQSTTVHNNNVERTSRNEGTVRKSLSQMPYGVPEELKRLILPDVLAKIIKQDMRLTHLQKLFEELSVPVSNELSSRLYALSHRLRNELICKLLENDSILTQAREVLMTNPPLPPVFNTTQMVNKTESNELNTSSNSIETSSGSTSRNCRVADPTWMAKQQIIAHLRFFSSLISLSITELGKEYTGAIITKVFENNLLEALSLVAERFAMPAGATGFAFKSLNANKFTLGGKGKTTGIKGIANNVFGDNINSSNNNKIKSPANDNDILDDDEDDDVNGHGDNNEDDEDLYDSYSNRMVESMNSNNNNNNNNSNMACFGSNNLNFSFKNSMLPSPSSLVASSSSSSFNNTPSSSSSGAAAATSGGGMRQTSLVQRNSGVCSANCYSEEVEQELVHLLDITIVRLNERQEEQIMNEIIRSPILADPCKYHGLMTFMVRELLLRTNTSSLLDCATTRQGPFHSQSSPPQSISSLLLSSSIWHNMLRKSTTNKKSETEGDYVGLWHNVRLHDAMVGIRNPCLLFHVLGLHDDEGATAGERLMDYENMEVRNKFHNFVITKYLMYVIKGSTQFLSLPISVLDDLYSASQGKNRNNNTINNSSNSSSPQSSEAVDTENKLTNESHLKSVPIVQFSNTHSTTGSGSFDNNGLYMKHLHGSSNNNNNNNSSTGRNSNNYINNKGNTSSKVVQELNMHSRLSCDIQSRKRREMFMSSTRTNYLDEDVTLSSAISSPFIKLLDYLIRLSNLDNREILLKMLFHRKSIIWQYIINCWKLACQQSALRANRRLERCILQKQSLTNTKENIQTTTKNSTNTNSSHNGGGGNNSTESKTISKGMESKQKSVALPLTVKPARIDVNDASDNSSAENKGNFSSNDVEEANNEVQHNANASLLFIGDDILCINVRFLRTVLSQCVSQPGMVSDVVLLCYSIPDKSISRECITNMCRQLTVECDLFGPMLQAFNATGGVRHRSVFHSAVLSVLDLIGKLQPPSEEQFDREHNSMYDIRNYLVFKYWELLPVQFTKIYREAILDETCHRLGHEITFENSISVMSSTVCSEALRSSSKLRFVDEVEAVTGGVDGTVEVASITNLNPEVVANVTSSEEKLMRERNRRHSSIGQQQSSIPSASITNINIGKNENNNNNNNTVKNVPEGVKRGSVTDDAKQSAHGSTVTTPNQSNNNNEKERDQSNGAAGRRGGSITSSIKLTKSKNGDILSTYSKSLVKPIETNSYSQPLSAPISLKEHSSNTTESSGTSRLSREKANTTSTINTIPSSNNNNKMNASEVGASSRPNAQKYTNGEERSLKATSSANDGSKFELSAQENESLQKDKNNNNHQVNKENSHSTASSPSSPGTNGANIEKSKSANASDSSNTNDNVNSTNSNDDNVQIKSGFKPITPKTERPVHRPRSYNAGECSPVSATAGSVPIELLSRSNNNNNNDSNNNTHHKTTTPSPMSTLQMTSNGTHSPSPTGDGLLPSKMDNNNSSNSNTSAHVALPRLRKKHLASNANRKSIDKS